MRVTSTIVSALSLVLMIFAIFFGVRSYWRYEGALHYGEGSPTKATASGKNGSLTEDFVGRSTGWLSYRGQITYVSIVNPVEPLTADRWETWSVDASTPPARGTMVLVWDVRLKRGLAGGSALTTSGLGDPIFGASWQLPYRFFTVPYWLLALLFAILPYRWVARFRQVSRWEREGRCGNCGAVLPPAAAKCPQCGQAVEVDPVAP